MVKKILQFILGTIIQGIITWILAILVSKLQDIIYDKCIKKPFCSVCGGSGYRTQKGSICACNSCEYGKSRSKRWLTSKYKKIGGWHD
jgi:hypothetical protein